jgi:hypothetical protein
MLMDIRQAMLPTWFLHLDIVVLAYSCNKRTVILAMKHSFFPLFQNIVGGLGIRGAGHIYKPV